MKAGCFRMALSRVSGCIVHVESDSLSSLRQETHTSLLWFHSDFQCSSDENATQLAQFRCVVLLVFVVVCWSCLRSQRVVISYLLFEFG